MTVQINRVLCEVSTNHVSMNLAAVKRYVQVSKSEKFSSNVLEKTPRRNLKIVNKGVEEWRVAILEQPFEITKSIFVPIFACNHDSVGAVFKQFTSLISRIYSNSHVFS